MNKKFIESKNINDFEVLTDTGWSDVAVSHKTIKYTIYEIETENELFLKCADYHILFNKDFDEVYCKDLNPNDVIITEEGPSKVVSINKTDLNENMYDLELNDSNHRYFTNGILSHNTSTAVAMCKHFGNDYMYINASLEGRIDLIKNKIESFSHNFSLIPNDKSNGEKTYKVVILDEVEGASAQFFDALRSVIEAYSKTTRFILTTNYINKVPDPIISRFGGGISYDFEKDEEPELIKKYLRRIKDILFAEGIKLKGVKYDGVAAETGWNPKAVIELIKRLYPDFRKILTTIQGFIIEGKEDITIEDIKKGYSVHGDVFKLITDIKTPRDNYQYLVSNYQRDVDAVFTSLNNEFIDYLNTNFPDKAQYIPQVVIKLAEYEYQSQIVIDPIISLCACVFEIQSIIVGAGK